MRELPLPHPRLRCSVVVPARDEEALIGSCLDALAAQHGVDHSEYEVLVVLDGCRDATRLRVDQATRRHASLQLAMLDGPEQGAGPARRTGMDAACARLLSLGRSEGLVACTDADSTVAPDWIAAQLEAVGRGARAIGGRIELSASEQEQLGPVVIADRIRRQRTRRQLVLNDPGPAGSTAEHWQFSGASLAVTAAVYRAVGGMAVESALEDEAFERMLITHGIPIHRSLAVRVTTSGRLDGRAEKGLARDLAAAARATGRP